jgi:hypothetical protein
MHLHDYLLRHHRPAKKAAANLKIPGVVCAPLTKIYHAGFADTVPTLQVILRSPAQTGEADAIAPDVASLIFKTLEVSAIYLYSRFPSPVDGLPKIL